MVDALSDEGYVLTTASNGKEGMAYVEQQRYDLVLLDYSLPDTDGLELLSTLLRTHPDMPVVMVTAAGSERIAVNALKTGASDYVVKSEEDFLSKLPHIVKDNLDKCRMKRRNRELEDQLRNSYKQLQELNKQLEAKVENRTEELERAYQLSNELMSKAVDSNMQLAELYSEVDESRRKLDTKIRILSLLNDVGKEMASSFEKETLLQVAIEAAHQELGVNHCAILLLNEDTERLHIGASSGTPDDLLLAARSLRGEQELLEVIRHNNAVLIQDIEGDERYHLLVQDFPGVESLILVPLCVKDLELGIFTVYGYEQRETLTDQDLEFVSSLASQAAIALANIFVTERRIQAEYRELLSELTEYVIDELDRSFTSIKEAVHYIGGEKPDAQTCQEYTQSIVTDLNHIRGTAQELFEFSRGQHGILTIHPYSVRRLVQDILGIIQQEFSTQHIKIHTALEYTGDMDIDVEKMRRVLLNLADNARHAMKDGGTFTITSRLVDERVILECLDEGGGISLDEQAHLFEPFASADEARTPGLRMAIVKKILDEHAAHIEISSTLGKGTTIRISLPLHQRR